LKSSGGSKGRGRSQEAMPPPYNFYEKRVNFKGKM